MKKTYLNLLLSIVLAGCVATGGGNRWASQSVTELKQGIEAEHPAAYYTLAQKLFANEATKNEAIYWFYVGQLRFRYHLAANPGLAPSGDPALFASLSEVVGRPINEYAGGHPAAWIAGIDRALQWDASHENLFTPKSRAPKAYRDTRLGLLAMRNEVISQKAIRRQNGRD